MQFRAEAVWFGDEEPVRMIVCSLELKQCGLVMKSQ